MWRGVGCSRAPQAAAAIDVDGGLSPDVVALLEPERRRPDVLVGYVGVTSDASEGALHARIVSEQQVEVACAERNISRRSRGSRPTSATLKNPPTRLLKMPPECPTHPFAQPLAIMIIQDASGATSA